MKSCMIDRSFPQATVLMGLLLQASGQARAQKPVVYDGPIVITRGGTYTGHWESLDPNVAAVTIRTIEPVVIQGATIRGRGHLIRTAIGHARLTVRDTAGYGLNPDVAGRAPGRFLSAEGFDGVALKNNYLEGTSGIYLLDYDGDRSPADTVRVVGNRALNIDGRKSDGRGGFLDFNTRTRKSDGFTEDGFELVQFLQLNKVRGVPAMEVAWNEVVNEPGRSRVEDNINIYLSGGTAASPMLVHDNYIRGAYTIRPWQASYEDATWKYDWEFSGGGILLGDGSSSDPSRASSFVRGYRNQVVSTTNYAIAIAAGHDLDFSDNRIVSADLLPDGWGVSGDNSGAYIWDLYKTGPGTFYNNTGSNNVVGWLQGGKHLDWWMPDATSWSGNVHWAGSVTPETEGAEFALWRQKYADAASTVVPRQKSGRRGVPPQRRRPTSPPSTRGGGHPADLRVGEEGCPTRELAYYIQDILQPLPLAGLLQLPGVAPEVKDSPSLEDLVQEGPGQHRPIG